MKYSESKKYKIRKRKTKKMGQYFNSIVSGDDIPIFALLNYIELSEEEMPYENQYIVISKFRSDNNFYVLCKEITTTNINIVIMKMVYTDMVRLVILSNKKVLENVDLFRKKFRHVNFEKRKERVKYSISESGQIIEKSTDYSTS